jgi:hypothetical protein
MAGLFSQRVAGKLEQEELGLDLGSLAVGLNTIALSLMEEVGKGQGSDVDRDLNDLIKQVKALEVAAQEVDGDAAVERAIGAVQMLVNRLEGEQREFVELERRHGRNCRGLAEEAKRIEKEMDKLREGRV